MTTDDIDLTGKCSTCGAPAEHYAGIPGNKFMTPFWRHTEVIEGRPHPATPDPSSVVAAQAA